MLPKKIKIMMMMMMMIITILLLLLLLLLLIIIIIIIIIIIMTSVAISGDRSVIKKEIEKILKYKELTIEVECMWNVKTKAILVIMGENGTV